MKNIFIQKSCNIGNISKVDLIDLSLMMTLDSLDRYENNEQKSLNCLRYLFAYENNICTSLCSPIHRCWFWLRCDNFIEFYVYVWNPKSQLLVHIWCPVQSEVPTKPGKSTVGQGPGIQIER